MDTVIADGFDSTDTSVADGGSIPADKSGFDIGPKTMKLYKAEIAKAKTVIWNGPWHVREAQFAAGTKAIAESVAAVTSKGTVTIIGGGDSQAAIEQMHLSDKVSHVSAGSSTRSSSSKTGTSARSRRPRLNAATPSITVPGRSARRPGTSVFPHVIGTAGCLAGFAMAV
ncbi:MAG: phosphoglycerate kinase [Rubrivivax sp.]